MTALPVPGELPEGFLVREGARGVLAARSDVAPALARAGFGPDGGGGRPSAELSGRGQLLEIELSPGRRLVVRPFRHGGLLRWLTGTRFADPARPFRELVLGHTLRTLGLPTPAVVAARAVRAGLFGWRLDLVSERVEGVRDLAEVLEALRAGRVAPAVRRRLADALGSLIGRLHRAGVWHADLQPRNVLVGEEQGELELWIIDLEGSRHGPLGEAERRQNLTRLARAVLRRERRGAAFLRATDAARFLRAYGRTLGRGWRADWPALVQAARRPSLAHRIGWWLEERLGHPERRDGAAEVRRIS